MQFRGEPATLPDVPAFPMGHAQMIVTPTKYRFKQRFISVQAGQDNHITEYFFVDPDYAKPQPIAYADLQNKSYGGALLQILQASGIDAARWNKLDPSIRATILNLSAKMRRERMEDVTELLTFMRSIDRTWLDLKHRDRVYARVDPQLLHAVRAFLWLWRSVQVFGLVWNSRQTGLTDLVACKSYR